MNRQDLYNALNAVKPGIASKETIESMTFFFLDDKRIVAYNDQICVQYPINLGVSCFVKAIDFYKVLSKLTSDEITITLKDQKLNVKSGKNNINLATIMDEELVARIKKVNKSLKDIEWKKLPSNFTEAITSCAFCASKNESQGTITYVKIEDKEVIATNNSQAAMYKIDGKVDLMYLKALSVKDISNLNPSLYSVSKAWVHFKNEDNCIFSVRKVEGDFPNLKDIFGNIKADSIDIPEDIKDGIDVASIFVDNENPYVSVKFEDNKCTIDVKSQNGSSSSYSTKMKYKEKAISFNINPDFLLKMLKHSSKLKVSDSIAMIESDGFKIATALVG